MRPDIRLPLDGGDGSHAILFIVEIDGRLVFTADRARCADGRVLGVEVVHAWAPADPDSTDVVMGCGGFIAWDTPSPGVGQSGWLRPTGHTLVSLDPLTVSPSLDCPRCGSHGFIRDDRWSDC